MIIDKIIKLKIWKKNAFAFFENLAEVRKNCDSDFYLLTAIQLFVEELAPTVKPNLLFKVIANLQFLQLKLFLKGKEIED